MLKWLTAISQPIDVIVNVIALGAYIYGFFALMRARSRYLERRRLLDIVPADGTVAVAIGVGQNVRPDVDRFLKTAFASVPVVVDYHRPGVCPAAEFGPVVREIRTKLQHAMATGTIRKALLFYGGPSAILAGIGALADNWVPLDIYQFNPQTRDYEYTFTLDVETVKGL